MVFSHAFAGAALTKLVESGSDKKLFKKNRDLFYLIGITSAILPDLDILYLLLYPALRHREFISHSIIPYIILSLIIWIISQIRESKKLSMIALLFFVGTISHLFFDFIAGGIAVLAPLTFQVYGFSVDLPSEPTSWLTAYMRSKFMVMEFGVFLLYVGAVKGSKNLVLKLLPLVFFTIAVISILYLVAFVYP